MAYDRQLIIQLDFDATIDGNAKALNDAWNSAGLASELVKMRGQANTVGDTYFDMSDVHKLSDAAQKLTKQSRVYLQAHGDWQSQKLGIYSPLTICDMIANSGMAPVKTISVLGCSLGRDAGTANDVRVSNSVNSFASNLHSLLGNRRQFHVDLFARIYDVAIGNTDWLGQGSSDLGRKYTFNTSDQWDDQQTGHKKAESKIRFYWEGGAQKREWAY